MRGILRVCLSVLLLGTVAAWAVTLEGPASSIIRVTHNPCWVHADHVCSVVLNPQPARLLPAGGSGWFQNTFGGQYPGWTLNAGASLNGTFRITQYDAFNDDNPGGAEFRMNYQKGAGDPDITWSQGILTNHRLNGPAGQWASYMDVLVSDDPYVWDPPAYPYQYTDQHFYDKPSRPCPANGTILWVGEAYATEIDYSSQQMTVHDGVEWGFIYSCYGKTPLVADDGSGTTGATTGSRDTGIVYTPGGPPHSGTLAFQGPINIMNRTGGNELAPEFMGDPLGSCWMKVWGLQMVDGPDPTGGYQFLSAGEPGEFNMEIVDFMMRPVLYGQVMSLYCNDALRYEIGGFNMVAVYGDILVDNPIGSGFLNVYNFNLHYQEDEEFVNAPKFVATTMGPFSQLLGDGMQYVEGYGVAKNGFAEERGGSIYEPGDMNCDGLVNAGDIPAFVQGLTEPDIYAINHPDCPMEEVGDCNGDGLFNAGDIPAFVDLLIGGG